MTNLGGYFSQLLTRIQYVFRKKVTTFFETLKISNFHSPMSRLAGTRVGRGMYLATLSSKRARLYTAQCKATPGLSLVCGEGLLVISH